MGPLRPSLLASLSIAASAAAAGYPHASSIASRIEASNGGCIATHDGYLRVRARGVRNLDIDWRDRDLLCAGGLRPDQAGLRLTFAGPPRRNGHRLRFVFGIGAMQGAAISRDVPANVTVIFEGDGKIYSTRGDDKCTIDELSQTPLGTLAVAAPRQAPVLRVAGRGFCVAPATAINGNDGQGLLLSRFDFVGVLTEDDTPTEPDTPKH